MTVYDQTLYPVAGAVLTKPTRVVVVHDGRRGPIGPEGPEGPEGPKGDSFHLRGQWVSGSTYCPLDAVSWRSSALVGVSSLYIQKEATPCSLSTLEPHLDLGRWIEIGANKLGDAFGGIWQVYQVAHGFTKVGQPIAFSHTADRYVLADARVLAELAIAVVREIVSPDVVILQSTGEVPNIDPEIILPDGSSWDPGRIYYVSTLQGRVQREPPADPSAYTNPILIATDQNGSPDAYNGVVLPWTPAGGPGTLTRQLVGTTKYHFVPVTTTTVISGNDLDGKTLAYIPGQVEVFINGANLFRGAFTALNGTSITLATPVPAGTQIEVWTAAQSTIPVLPATSLKLDNIEDQFDGFQTDFVLSAGGTPVPLQSPVNLRLWLDATAQEAYIDFDVIEDPENAGFGLLHMIQPPEEGTRFWAILMQAAADADQIELRNANAAIEWRYKTGVDTAWKTLVPLADLAFEIDAMGLDADLNDYDEEDPGFTYLATDTGLLYFRLTFEPGVWSDPVQFTGPQGDPGVDGTDGTDGASAYAIAVAHGFIGTEEEWLLSLKGEDGEDGGAGDPGLSAYQIAVNDGFVGTEEEWLASLQGPQGPPGDLLFADLIDAGDLATYNPGDDDFTIDSGELP